MNLTPLFAMSMFHKISLGSFLILVTCMMPCTSVVAAPTSAATNAATTDDGDKQPPRCNVLDRYYFQSLPGVVAYCYARRNWAQGHYRAAMERFKRAASWGSKDAQYSLGLIHYTGRHVAINKPLGIAWLELAAERDDPDKVQVAKSAQKLASAKQKRQARQLLSRMRGRYADKVAAARAWKHYQHARRYQKMAKMNVVGPKCQSLRESNNNFAAEIQCWQEQANKRRLEKKKNSLVEQYFQGWIGTVKVGPLQTKPAPAATTSGD